MHQSTKPRGTEGGGGDLSSDDDDETRAFLGTASGAGAGAFDVDRVWACDTSQNTFFTVVISTKAQASARVPAFLSSILTAHENTPASSSSGIGFASWWRLCRFCDALRCAYELPYAARSCARTVFGLT